MELAVFHHLHCLNELRMALDNGNHESIPRNENHHQDKVHLNHCVDQIRQALMCHSDLTPVPMKELEGEAELGNSQEHTCRDFDAIWQWVGERSKKQKALGD